MAVKYHRTVKDSCPKVMPLQKTAELKNDFVQGREALVAQCGSGLANLRTKNNATTARKSIML